MTSVLIALLLITVCASAALHVMGWLRDRRVHSADLPPLVLPLAHELGDGAATAVPPSDPDPSTVATGFALTSPTATSRVAPPVVGALVDEDFADEDRADDDMVDVDPLDTADTVHVPRATAEAIQLLPARLEVLSGMPRRQEIRFVRTPGRPPHMILGRAPGGSPHHVTLTSSTVSRRHARVAFANGEWKVVNLSTTNPVVVNDRALSGKRSERVLTDGDTIELGEVVLRFRAS